MNFKLPYTFSHWFPAKVGVLVAPVQSISKQDANVSIVYVDDVGELCQYTLLVELGRDAPPAPPCVSLQLAVELQFPPFQYLLAFYNHLHSTHI